MELQSKAAAEKDPAMDYMLLQGVRFAFRIHQVSQHKKKVLVLILSNFGVFIFFIVFQMQKIETYFLFDMQFAGGFDADTMHAFEELRYLAHLLNKK